MFTVNIHAIGMLVVATVVVTRKASLTTLQGGQHVPLWKLPFSPSGQRRRLQAPILGVRLGDGVASCNRSGGMERAYLHAPAKKPC